HFSNVTNNAKKALVVLRQLFIHHLLYKCPTLVNLSQAITCVDTKLFSSYCLVRRRCCNSLALKEFMLTLRGHVGVAFDGSLNIIRVVTSKHLLQSSEGLFLCSSVQAVNVELVSGAGALHFHLR